MAALLSNAFGRKNLLGSVSAPKPDPEMRRPVPSPGITDPASSDVAMRNRSNANEAPYRSRPGTSDSGNGERNRNNAALANGTSYPVGNPLNQPLWSPSQANRPAAFHVRDPVSMHLLMENALDDSRSFEVLEPDSVTSTRSELDSVKSRVEAMQRKLALETKVRDAAKSMNQLEKIEEAHQAAQRCDALQEELFKLQREEQLLQKRLLEHTAGVLQMTHKGYLKDQPDMSNGVTFEQAHLYEPSMLLDALDGGSGNKLSEEQQDMIGNIQKKVEALNGQLRNMLLELNAPSRDVPVPLRFDGNQERVIETTLDQLTSLDQSFSTMTRLQHSQKRDHVRDQASLREQLREQTTREQSAAKGKVDEAVRNVGQMNQTLYRTLVSSGKHAKLASPPDGASLPAQMQYFEAVQQTIQDQTDDMTRHDAALRRLWDGVASSSDGEYSLAQLSSKIEGMNIKYSSLQDQKDVLTRQIQQQRELNESGGKDAEIADLKEQLARAQADLDRTEQDMDSQIEKLSSTIDDLEATKASMNAENEADKAALAAELEASQQAYNRDIKDAKTKHDREITETKRTHEREISMSKITLEKELANEKFARSTAEDTAYKAQEQLKEANSLMEVNSLAIKADLEAKTKAAAEAEKNLHELEGEVARLQTELTIAKAELDGAYGTRAERAAERDPELQARVKALETELQETITDYEAMTKATIEHEREKDEIESTLDSLRDKVEGLENELAEERVGSMGGKTEGSGAGATSAAVLRTEFKKMMKDAREQHSKAMKGEKDERRKLEAQVRQLRRDALARGKPTAGS